MGKSLLSNPPYNIKWQQPIFAQLQSRFADYGVPPSSNANYAFVLSALDLIDDKAAILLPLGVLNSDTSEEAAIRKRLIERNVIEAVIVLPDKMFESTSISTCILLLNKTKKTCKIEMIDLRKAFIEEQRDQRGQYGGAAHENRVYHKTVKVITEATIKMVQKAIREQESIPELCSAVSIEEIRSNGYILVPSRYIGFQQKDYPHRSYADIAADYNRVVKAKNALKLTVNESLAKTLGIYDLYLSLKNQPDISQAFAIVEQTVETECFMQISKNAAEFKIENKNREMFPELLLLFLKMWKQHIMYLNNEENRLLAEFRDALLPDLMSGKIQAISDGGEEGG